MSQKSNGHFHTVSSDRKFLNLALQFVIIFALDSLTIAVDIEHGECLLEVGDFILAEIP